MPKVRATSCYLSPEERRAIEEIAAKEERARAKIIQFAVRDFIARYHKGILERLKEPASEPAR